MAHRKLCFEHMAAELCLPINIGWWTFLLAGALALAIALLKLSYQAIRAATANPALVLRYE